MALKNISISDRIEKTKLAGPSQEKKPNCCSN
jgi:hypothetical protein